jgi:hypothetical protein
VEELATDLPVSSTMKEVSVQKKTTSMMTTLYRPLMFPARHHLLL